MRCFNKTVIVTIVANIIFLIHHISLGAETVAPDANVQLQQIALFKNGLGFFVSEVTCPEGSDSFSFMPAIAPSHGTFWVAYPPDVKLQSLTVKQADSTELIEAITMSELLEANVGRKVRLSLSGEEELTVDGVIKYFADERELPEPDPYIPGRAEQLTPSYRRTELFRGSLMTVQTDQMEVCIDPQQVKMIEFLNGQAQKSFAKKSKIVRIVVKMRSPADGQKLTISYLAKGITWAPSYIIDITNPDEAIISAKAVVINEACDLKDTTIQMVTGFPHLQFADIVSPLALKESLAQFLQSLTRGESEHGRVDVMSNVMRQSVAYGGMGGHADSVMPAYGAAEAGKVAEDLFLYPVEKVQLKKGEVGYFPLFSESVPYKHIYQWKIPDYINEQERYYYDRRRDEEHEPEEEVWHCLRLENITKVPWTTAPAETVKEGLVIGQDTLNYTAVQGETTLRITQAVNVKTEQVELETDRDREALRLYNDYFDLVTIEGNLSVANFQNKAITLEITKTLSGEIKSLQPEAMVETLARGLRRMNAVRNLTWTIDLKPGEQKQLSYIYEVYVRR
jgi:hypothetical protein